MKKLILYASRLEKPDYLPADYDNYELGIKTPLPKSLSAGHDIRIRIFAANCQPIGSSCITIPPTVHIRNFEFNIQSFLPWEDGLYTVVLYSDEIARFHGTMTLEKSNSSLVEMIPVRKNSIEKFITEDLCYNPWWTHSETQYFKPDFALELIRKLAAYQKTWKKTGMLPNILIAGGTEHCREIMAKLIIENTRQEDIILSRLPMEDFRNGTCLWDNPEKEILQNEVFLIDTDAAEWCEKRYVEMLSKMLRRKKACQYNLILTGTKNAADKLLRENMGIKRHFQDFNCIWLPETDPNAVYAGENACDEENDKDFEELLQDFISNAEEEEEETWHHLSDSVDMDSPESDAQPAVTESESDYAEEALENMIGLKTLKKDLETTKIMALFMQKRKEYNLDSKLSNRYHTLFLGNPGTGKSTVARLLGSIYHKMGILSKGHTIVTHRAELVGQFIGETEKKTLEIIEKARGGVLFIDEAYTLYQEKDSKDFGREVINTLLPVLAESNSDLIVILAGYTDKIECMLNANPGLKERFPICLHFEDYTDDELLEIACQYLSESNFYMTYEAKKTLLEVIRKKTSAHDANFSNARWIQNLIEQGILKSMARRVMNTIGAEESVDPKILITVEAEDIATAETFFPDRNTIKMSSPRPIGFLAG